MNMTRSEVLKEIWELDYPLYDDRVRALIGKFDWSDPHQKASQNAQLAETIWSELQNEFDDINRKSSGGNQRETDAALLGELTSSGSASIIAYIDDAEAWQDLDDAEFYARYDERRAQIRKEKQLEWQTKGEERDQSAFFNRLPAQVDMNEWSKLKSWSIGEGVSLLFGKDPNVVSPKTVRDYKCIVGSPFKDKYLQRLDIIQRAVDVKELTEPVKPIQLVSWCRKNGIDLHPEIEVHFSLKSKNRHSPQSATTNRLNKCYHVILGLLAANYPTSPTGKRGPAQFDKTKALEALARVNAGIDRKTLDNIIRDALSWANGKDHPLRRATPKESNSKRADDAPPNGNSQI